MAIDIYVLDEQTSVSVTNQTMIIRETEAGEGCSEIYLRISEGFLQYSTDNVTWNNLATVQNGQDGEDGDDGIGIQSIAKTGTNGLVDTYTITFTNDTKTTFTVTNGKDGSNYVLTTADKEEIAGMVNVPVKSVNGKTGAVNLSASDVGARPNTWTPSASEVGAEASGTATSKVSEHNTSETSHNDIRLLIEGLTNKLNALSDSDDTTLDQMSEIVAYIKSNKSLIDAITTGKVSVSDIIDNLTTSVSNKPLSAKQGVALKALIDEVKTTLNNLVVPTKTSQLTNDSGFLTQHQDLSGYAPKATTLAGYGITDGATKGELGQVQEQIADQQNEIDNKQPKGNYVKSVNGNTPNENGDVTVIVQAEAPTFVGSVDEMVDTSKQYVLKSTGTIWEYKETTYEKDVTVRNDITSGYERGRLSSGGANSGDVQTHTLTPLIDITKAEYQGKTIQIHLEGNRYFSEDPETYIMTAVFDTSKGTIFGRLYSMLNRSDGLLSKLDNVGATAEIHSTTSATLTIPVPLVDDSSNNVGYFRFCGLGTVDGTVYITYTETQTVTEEAWTDTGVSFGSGGSIDTETLDKISELNNEGADPTTIRLLAQPVLDFYNASAYLDSDYTTSHLSNITYPCRADIPVPFTVKWEYNEDAMRTTVAVDTKAIGTNNAYTLKTYDATGLNKFPLYNLLPNTRYYYKVTHVLSDGSLVEAKSGNFLTSSEPWRLLYIDGTQNVRDLGGWTGLNGKKVKYGKIIRGASLNDSSLPNLIVTGKGRLALGELNIQAELNLGAIDNETSIASNCAYKKLYYTNYAIAITNETYRTMFKTILEYIVSCLDGTLTVSGLNTVARNIYMHCQGGCDRTATLSFLLLGLLGVSESDLAKEYELSSFSDVGFGRRRNTTLAVDVYDYVGMVQALKAYSGSTITDKFYDFATTGCGISADTITAFRNLMLE